MTREFGHGNPSLELDGEGIGWITFDDSERKVNLLTEEVMRRLGELAQEARALAASGQLRALVVRSAKPRSFIAGADVDQIRSIEDPSEGERASRLGQDVFAEIETIAVPTVAAIHGTCLGGGTELSLACRYRLASDSDATRIGLPEVQLGILPAWGGTTRLPRLIGLQAALQLLLTGDRVSARRSKRLGLVDRVLSSVDFEAQVRAFVQERLEEGPTSTGADRGLVRRLAEDTWPGRRLVLAAARRRVMKRTGGHYPAPLRILDVLKDGLGVSPEKAFALEARTAGELIVSSVSKNLIHVFQLRERARKGNGVGAEVEARPVERVGILGAGVMGGGIAQLLSYKGRRVRMKDIEHDAVRGGLRHARSLFDKAVEKKKMDRGEAEAAMKRISGGTEYEGFGTADVVIEAVVERMDVKREVLRETESRVREDAVLATNTSSLSIDELAEALERPGSFGGMHFFNPVHRMPLVEVVRGAATDDVTVATLYRFAVDLGKVPVVTADGAGFLVNRILGAYLNEAGWLLAEGVSVEAIDGAAEAFGMPMGPLRLVDEVGIDVARHAGESLHEAFGERMAPAPPLVAIGETDRLGKKGGLGFYRYDDGKPDGVDESVYEALGDAVPGERKETGDRRIRARLVLSMINEAARILEDRIVRDAGDVDLGMVMGTGFPPFRGGLLRFADDVHPRTVLTRLEDLEATVGSRFSPAPLVRELAERDQGFYDAFPARG